MGRQREGETEGEILYDRLNGDLTVLDSLRLTAAQCVCACVCAQWALHPPHTAPAGSTAPQPSTSLTDSVGLLTQIVKHSVEP